MLVYMQNHALRILNDSYDFYAQTVEESTTHHQTTARRLTRSPEAVFVVI